MTRSGSLAPPNAYGAPVENGGKLWWAVRDSNPRPFRCKRKPRPQICHSLQSQSQDFANLCGFRSLYNPWGGSIGSSQTFRVQRLNQPGGFVR
jgi:hypothetical protein